MYNGELRSLEGPPFLTLFIILPQPQPPTIAMEKLQSKCQKPGDLTGGSGGCVPICPTGAGKPRATHLVGLGSKETGEGGRPHCCLLTVNQQNTQMGG